MSLSQKPTYISPEEYLEGELSSPVKHEYIQGQVYAMSGVSDPHNAINGNVYSLLRTLLRGTRCRIFFTDVKVRIEVADTFYYPDVFVTCHESDRTEKFVKYRPTLVVEVLSPSTETFDRGTKRAHYQMLDSIQDYITIRQDSVLVEHHYRGAEGQWLSQSYEVGEEVPISGLNITLPVDTLYEDIDFQQLAGQ